MTSESNRISAASIAYVNGVCRAWGWSWSEMGQADDDGLDGLVYLRVKQVDAGNPLDRRSWRHTFTGGLIHVQVKSGSSYVRARTNESIEVLISNLSAKRDLWMKSPLPVALVFVQDEAQGRTPKNGWWADLKAPDAYSARDTVLIPLKNRFQPGLECRRPFERLASGQLRRLALPEVDLTVRGSLPNKLKRLSSGRKAAAIAFYSDWKRSGATNPSLGAVLVNRTGWAHITRVGRPVARIETSLELLPAAARILAEVTTWRVLRRGPQIRTFADGSWATYDYLGLSAIVKWPARQPSEAMVILRRQTLFAPDPDSLDEGAPENIRMAGRRIWFYSVYEPGRRRQSN